MSRCIKFASKALSIIVLIMVSTPVFSEAPSGYLFMPFDKGINMSLKTGKKIFLYYGRKGCGYCDKTNKKSFSQNAVKKAISENFILIYVDAEGGRRMTLPSGERVTEMQLGSRLNALVTPVFMFLEPNGSKILNVPGFQTAESFLSMVDYVKNDHYKNKSLSQFQDIKK